MFSVIVLLCLGLLCLGSLWFGLLRFGSRFSARKLDEIFFADPAVNDEAVAAGGFDF